jgi:hypothetical protein
MVFAFRFTQIKLLPNGFAKLETFAGANRSPFTAPLIINDSKSGQ